MVQPKTIISDSYSGQLPALFGGDLIEYSPTRVAHGSKPEGTTESFIARAKAGQLLTLTWHWNAPKDVLDAPYTDKNGKKVEAHWYSGFYTYSTTFNLETALANPNSEDYKLLLSDIDTISVELKKTAAENIPVLWRPLHEAEGGWFWWGAKGPKPFVQLWRLMFDRLTNVLSPAQSALDLYCWLEPRLVSRRRLHRHSRC